MHIVTWKKMWSSSLSEMIGIYDDCVLELEYVNM